MDAAVVVVVETLVVRNEWHMLAARSLTLPPGMQTRLARA